MTTFSINRLKDAPTQTQKAIEDAYPCNGIVEGLCPIVWIIRHNVCIERRSTGHTIDQGRSEQTERPVICLCGTVERAGGFLSSSAGQGRVGSKMSSTNNGLLTSVINAPLDHQQIALFSIFMKKMCVSLRLQYFHHAEYYENLFQLPVLPL